MGSLNLNIHVLYYLLQQFWTDLLIEAKEWGMILYEQVFRLTFI